MKDSDIFVSLCRRKSFLICTQCDVSRLPEMNDNISMGATLRGRILEKSKVVSIRGPQVSGQILVLW